MSEAEIVLGINSNRDWDDGHPKTKDVGSETNIHVGMEEGIRKYG